MCIIDLGFLVTWGDSNNGGDSSDVTLSDVRKIYSTDYAFAALLADDSVVAWGDPDYDPPTYDL